MSQRVMESRKLWTNHKAEASGSTSLSVLHDNALLDQYSGQWDSTDVRDLTIGGEGLLDVTAREQRRAQYVTRRGEVDVEA
jgi:hypothetical protein